MAASTAFPPRAMTASPACVARASAVATMRCGARTVVYGTDGVVTAAPYRRPSALTLGPMPGRRPPGRSWPMPPQGAAARSAMNAAEGARRLGRAMPGLTRTTGRVLQHRLQHLGPVGHDAVDAEIEQRSITSGSSIVHTCTCSPRRGRPHRRAVTTGTPLPQRHLRHRDLRLPNPPGSEARRQPSGDLEGSHRRAQLRAERAAACDQAPVGEPAHADPLRRRVRRKTSMSGATPASLLTSMLNRGLGERGRAGPPAAGSARFAADRAVCTSDHGSSLIRPGRPQCGSRSSSWNATSTPSAVTRTSVSMYR